MRRAAVAYPNVKDSRAAGVDLRNVGARVSSGSKQSVPNVVTAASKPRGSGAGGGARAKRCRVNVSPTRPKASLSVGGVGGDIDASRSKVSHHKSSPRRRSMSRSPPPPPRRRGAGGSDRKLQPRPRGHVRFSSDLQQESSLSPARSDDVPVSDGAMICSCSLRLRCTGTLYPLIICTRT